METNGNKKGVMVNLLEETVECMKKNGKNPSNVLFVNTDEGFMRWKDFADQADEYYNYQSGHSQVRSDLVIIGVDFWMERTQYGDTEWWVYYEKPPVNGRYVKESIWEE